LLDIYSRFLPEDSISAHRSWVSKIALKAPFWGLPIKSPDQVMNCFSKANTQAKLKQRFLKFMITTRQQQRQATQNQRLILGSTTAKSPERHGLRQF